MKNNKIENSLALFSISIVLLLVGMLGELPINCDTISSCNEEYCERGNLQ